MICTRPLYLKGMYLACGSCASCRIARANDWSMRAIHEASCHDDNCFVTLTYDDDHLPEGGTLVKRHLQLFFKRLRKYLGDQRIKYFACGEYGDEGNRPHYHILIFGWRPTDDDLECVGKKGKRLYYSSRVIRDFWTYGYNTVDEINPKTARYTAGYVQKKYKGDKAKEVYGDREPAFQLQSQGIGLNWCVDNALLLETKHHITYNGKPKRLPRYYVKKLGIAPEIADKFLTPEYLVKMFMKHRVACALSPQQARAYNAELAEDLSTREKIANRRIKEE